MSHLLEFEDAVAGDFDHKPFLIRHHLAEHPLFALERLQELSRRLRSDQAEFYAGNVPVYASPQQTPPTGLSLQETIQRIDGCGAWVVLKHVEQDPEYRTLLHRCLDEVGDVYGSALEGSSDWTGFIFISSGKAVTPCHLDPEHNFLLQIRGCKTIHVGERSLVAESELERYFTGGHRNVDLRDDFDARASEFRLSPGDGVHVPWTAPHWVGNGDDVSVSFSITFQTLKSRRRAIVHKVNAHLRKSGLHPAAPGRSPLRDSIKILGFEVIRRVRRLLRRVAPDSAATVRP